MTLQARALAVCITPFDENGGLDIEALRRHLARLVNSGLGICVGGSGTEEGFSLSDSERRTLIREAVTASEGRVEVRLNGREPRTTDEACADVALAAELGCSAAHVPILDIGHGYRPTEKELRRHFRTVCAEARLPVVISSSAAMSQVVPVEVLRDAVAEWGAEGVVSGSPELPYVAAVLEAVGEAGDVYVAGVPQLLNALSLGATGFLSPDANILPETAASVIAAWEAGDFVQVRRSVVPMLQLSSITLAHGVTASIKTILRGLNLLETFVRPPRRELEPEVAERILERAVAIVGSPAIDTTDPVNSV